MRQTFLTIISALIIFSWLIVGCNESSPSDPDIDPIESSEIELMDLRFKPWVTKPGEPFTLEVIIRGEVGSRIFFYPNLGARFGPDGFIIPNAPSRLMQDGLERDYLILQKDENYSENQVYLESRYTANNIIFNIEENVIAVSTIRDIRIHDPEKPLSFNSFKVLLPFRTANPTMIGTPSITQLDTDVRATSRIVNIISDEAEEIDRYYLGQLTQRYYQFFPDDRDFLIVQEPPNVENSVGGYFYHSGEREKGLGAEYSRNPGFFGSSGRLKGVIQSFRGVYSQSLTMDGNFCLLTHELLHRWAAYMGDPLSLDGSHWMIHPTTGLDREHSGFGRNRTCKLNDFELYLAGFIPADSVSSTLNRNGYTMDDFINENGPRIPAFPDTQHDFNIAFIIESKEALSDHEMAYFHFISKEVTKETSLFSLTWFEATGGRSRLYSKLEPTSSNSVDISQALIIKQ
ncbi:MAG: hypothetical protein GVY20_17625 [Bacteroidetes bacterium]|jgi:hypothetical protein|nr:hypothetical protein [Bacteroidota bacterium]